MATVKVPGKGDKAPIEIIDDKPDMQQAQHEQQQTAQAESEMQRRAEEIRRMAMEALQGAAMATVATQSPQRKPVTEAEMAQAEKDTLATVSGQERTRVKLPLINKNDPEVVVHINGVRYTIKRGQTVELPAAVVEALEHADML